MNTFQFVGDTVGNRQPMVETFIAKTVHFVSGTVGDSQPVK